MINYYIMIGKFKTLLKDSYFNFDKYNVSPWAKPIVNTFRSTN